VVPSSNSTPASIAVSNAGMLMKIASSMRSVFCVAAVMRPPKYSGTSLPIKAPETGFSSTSKTRNPAFAASIAAAMPLGPAPTTRVL
jgi:hypothetical protein